MDHKEPVQFKVGDTVRLKSGSPALVVTAVDDHGLVKVEWLDDKKRVQAHIFPVACLHKEETTANIATKLPPVGVSRS